MSLLWQKNTTFGRSGLNLDVFPCLWNIPGLAQLSFHKGPVKFSAVDTLLHCHPLPLDRRHL